MSDQGRGRAPITLVRLDPSLVPPRNTVGRLVRKVSSAIGREVTLLALGAAAYLHRVLLLPLALLTLTFAAAGLGFALYGFWVDVITCVVFTAFCLGVMAGLRWVAVQYVILRDRDLDRPPPGHWH